MTLKKRLAKSAVAFIFSTFLTIAILSYSLFQITDKETLKPIVLAISSSQVPPEQVAQMREFIIQQCGSKQTIDIPLQNEKITVDCNKIKNSPAEKTFEIIYSDNIDNIYNLEYKCEFLDCLRTQPAVIFSAKANNFFLSLTYISIILTVIFGILLAMLSRESGKFGVLRAFGWSFVFVGISYFFVLAAKTSLIPADVAKVAGPAIDIIFNIILFNLLIILIAGAILLAIGYIGSKLKKKKK
jgi:hypothetical protein